MYVVDEFFDRMPAWRYTVGAPERKTTQEGAAMRWIQARAGICSGCRACEMACVARRDDALPARFTQKPMPEGKGAP